MRRRPELHRKGFLGFQCCSIQRGLNSSLFLSILLALKYKLGLILMIKWQKSQELCSHKLTFDYLFKGPNTISGCRCWKALVKVASMGHMGLKSLEAQSSMSLISMLKHLSKYCGTSHDTVVTMQNALFSDTVFIQNKGPRSANKQTRNKQTNATKQNKAKQNDTKQYI